MRSTVRVNVDALVAFDDNPKTHPQEQLDVLVNSIKQFGFTNPILIDSDYKVLAGHGRLLAAKQAGMTEVECLVLEGLTEKQKTAYLIADNRIAQLGRWDDDNLLRLLDVLSDDADIMSSLGFTEDELNYLTLAESEEEIAPQVEVEPQYSSNHNVDNQASESRYYIMLEFEDNNERAAVLELLKDWQPNFSSMKFKKSNH